MGEHDVLRPGGFGDESERGERDGCPHAAQLASARPKRKPLEAALDLQPVDRRDVGPPAFDERDRAAVAVAGPHRAVEDAAAAGEVEHVEVHRQPEHVLVLDERERVDRPLVVLADLEQADVGLDVGPVEPVIVRKRFYYLMLIYQLLITTFLRKCVSNG